MNGVVNGLQNSTPLSEVRNLRIQELLRTQSKQKLERDPDGNPIVRAHKIVALSPAPEVLARATSLGFIIASTQTLEALGLTKSVLHAPSHWSTRKALKFLREA